MQTDFGLASASNMAIGVPLVGPVPRPHYGSADARSDGFLTARSRNPRESLSFPQVKSVPSIPACTRTRAKERVNELNRCLSLAYTAEAVCCPTSPRRGARKLAGG